MLDDQGPSHRWKYISENRVSKMGNGMNKILPGLYVGNFRDAKDLKQLEENHITHILSIHDNAKKILKDKEYLCLEASDSSDQDLTKFFPQVIKFIHKARLEGGGVLVHCLAGVSRSVTVTTAYIMTVTELGWRDALNAVRGARSVANPNYGFQKQLQNYDSEHVVEERKRLKRMFPEKHFNDEQECRYNLHCYQQYLLTGSTPTQGSDIYPLPYKAYQQNKSGEKSTEEDKEKVLHDSGRQHKNSHHHHHHHCHHHQQHHHHHCHHHNQQQQSNNNINDNSDLIDSLGNKRRETSFQNKAEAEHNRQEDDGDVNNEKLKAEKSANVDDDDDDDGDTSTNNGDTSTNNGDTSTNNDDDKKRKSEGALLNDF